jgi:peptidoglycan/xylan/chitin deacetylase (PgdA/CDA1 family)
VTALFYESQMPWPNGARCAACFSFDCDFDTTLHMARPEDAHRQVGPLSWLQHDEVAIPRIVRLFADFEVRQTFFATGWSIERYPHPFEAILGGGHEIAHHGYLHESPSDLTADAERYWLARASEVIEAFSGSRPRGYRAPLGAFSERTADLLTEEGFQYDSSLMHDSVPYLLKSAAGTLIELPTDINTMDDWSQYAQFEALGATNQPRSPQDAARVYLAEFEAAYEFGGLWITVFHPMVSGRPARLRGVRRIREASREKGDVWIAPLGEIAEHVSACTRDGTFVPRAVPMPPYPNGPIPERGEYQEGQ